MRSGDWKLSVPGQRWAVAFVWRTAERGYAWAINGHQTEYVPSLGIALRLGLACWRDRQGR